MESYGRFAGVYDVFMDNVNYREWADYIIETLAQDEIRDGLVLELGCGTGTVTEMLADAGYDMIGIDNSEEMLAEAMEKRAESGHDILYLLQDMQDFELYGTVRAVISVCDSMNYLTDEEDLEYLFALVNNYLDPGGLFIFDMNTIHKYRDVIGDTTIAEDREDGSFIWENSYDRENALNVYELALFLPREDGLYEKCEEEHVQKAYSIEAIKAMIVKAGMELVAVCDAYTHNPGDENCERLTFVAREHGKVHRTDIMEGFRRNLRHIARIDAIIAGLLINALFTGIAIDLMLSHGQNENNMKEITGVINE